MKNILQSNETLINIFELDNLASRDNKICRSLTIYHYFLYIDSLRQIVCPKAFSSCQLNSFILFSVSGYNTGGPKNTRLGGRLLDF